MIYLWSPDVHEVAVGDGLGFFFGWGPVDVERQFYINPLIFWHVNSTLIIITVCISKQFGFFLCTDSILIFNYIITIITILNLVISISFFNAIKCFKQFVCILII